MCDRDCRQGRDCDCGPPPGLVNGIAVLIWVACFIGLAAILWGVA